MLDVRIASLGSGVHRFHLEPAPGDLDLTDEAFDDVGFEAIEVDVTLDLTPTRIVASFHARAVAHLLCDRTLEPFSQPVEGAYTVLFTADAEMAEAGGDDVRFFTPAEPSIDLAEPVRDTLLLALPTRHAAPGAEDADLPMQFGAKEDMDPRWETLRRLRDGEPLN